MVRRVGNLFSKICDYDNLMLAHYNARKGKSHYCEVKMVNADPDRYIGDIQVLLQKKDFTTSKYKTQYIYEPKKRLIYKLPYFPDRIIQHAIMQVIQPIWDKTFITDLYSAIPGRGLHAGSYRLREFMGYNPQYCLKFDISKFYPSILHDELYNMIERKIKCKDTLWLIKDIIDSTEGVPIGNYLSQYFGNIYLNGFDHWLKEQNHIKYYIRYCDDGVILHNDKKYLHELLSGIQDYLEPLNMHLNNKTRIFPIKQGIDFLGYVHYPTHVSLRKSSKRNLIHRSRTYGSQSPDHVRSSVMSSVGWLSHCNSYNLLEKYILTSEITQYVDREEILSAYNPSSRKR